MSALALHVRSAGLAVHLHATAAVLARIAIGAIAIEDARRFASSVDAAVGPAGLDAADAARAEPVASAGRVHGGRRGTRCGLAGGVWRIAHAGAKAIAFPRGTARRPILARTGGIELALLDRRARAFETEPIAGSTGAHAIGVAAQSIGTVTGGAFTIGHAGRSGHLGSAAPRHAGTATDTVRVAAAGRKTLIGATVARERRADRHRPEDTPAYAIASISSADRVAVALAGLADGPQLEGLTFPRAIAGAIETAGRNRGGLALRGDGWFGTRRNRRANPRSRRQGAGHTRPRAGAVTAKSVDTETATAAGAARTSLADCPASASRVGGTSVAPVRRARALRTRRDHREER